MPVPVQQRRRARYANATTTVRLSTREISWLARTVVNNRRPSGLAIDRSALLRGLISGVAASGLNLAYCSNEDEISQAVSEAIKERSRG